MLTHPDHTSGPPSSTLVHARGRPYGSETDPSTATRLCQPRATRTAGTSTGLSRAADGAGRVAYDYAFTETEASPRGLNACARPTCVARGAHALKQTPRPADCRLPARRSRPRSAAASHPPTTATRSGSPSTKGHTTSYIHRKINEMRWQNGIYVKRKDGVEGRSGRVRAEDHQEGRGLHRVCRQDRRPRRMAEGGRVRPAPLPAGKRCARISRALSTVRGV